MTPSFPFEIVEELRSAPIASIRQVERRRDHLRVKLRLDGKHSGSLITLTIDADGGIPRIETTDSHGQGTMLEFTRASVLPVISAPSGSDVRKLRPGQNPYAPEGPSRA